MADPMTELRGAMVDQMLADATLVAMVHSRIYDEVPQSNTAVRLPYISLGPQNYAPELVDCIDGGEIMIQVDVWSNEPGQSEVSVIAGAVRKSLKGFEPDLTETAVVEFYHWRTDFLVDGAIKHAAIRFNAVVEETSS